MNILLTGLRGTGKTTIGQLLAEKLNRPFLDLDAEIEKEQQQKIAQIVEEKGWDFFRDLEHKICKKIVETPRHGGASSGNYIISTGGGTLIFDRNAKLFQKNSFIILLIANLKTLAKRIKNNTNRPSLTGKNFLEELNEVWQERKDKYEKVANLTIDTEGKTPEKISAEIITNLSEDTKNEELCHPERF